MTFAYPYFLLLLTVLPVLAWLKGKAGKPPAFVYSSIQLVRPIVNVTRARSGAFLAALRWLALALMIVALAQPRFTHSETSVRASGVDMVVALDMSGSMASEDFELRGKQVNRLEMAKDVLAKFIERRRNDRIGLVAFATQPYIAAPITLDHDFLQEHVKRLELGTIDNSHTAIGSGLSTAVNRLRDLKAKSKIVILMTDGQNNFGKIDPITAAEAARALGVKVYTIGVGTRGLAPIPVFWQGRKVGYRQEPVDIDEDTLQKIASLTGGKYYRADNGKRLEEVYNEIDKLERTEAEVRKYSHHNELFGWVIAPGLALLLIELVLRHTFLRRLP
jgi:Ca-activated chloride channel family protein